MSNAKQPPKPAKTATTPNASARRTSSAPRAKRTTLSDDDQLAMALAAEGLTPDYSQTSNPSVDSSTPQPSQQSNADNRSLREQMEQLEEMKHNYLLVIYYVCTLDLLNLKDGKLMS